MALEDRDYFQQDRARRQAAIEADSKRMKPGKPVGVIWRPSKPNKRREPADWLPWAFGLFVVVMFGVAVAMWR